MSRIGKAVRRFWDAEEGITAIEYALLALLIAIAIIGGATLLGGNINGLLAKVAGKLTT